MYRLPQALRLAIVPLAISDLAFAQTIIRDNVIVVADSSTVAPAAESLNGELVLTDAVISNLTDLSLTNISLFDFANSSIVGKHSSTGECKAFPGDPLYPVELVWDIFDLLTGSALIKTVPLASVCYESWGNYDSEECKFITDQWANVSLHTPDPTSLMFPLWEGATCLPTADNLTGNCTLGAYPAYTVNATTIAQIQLAVNFARNLNLRLVIKNTGHDFNGRSAGAGALSIWTHHFKDIVFYEKYDFSNYSGAALKIGAAVENIELYEAAEAYGVTTVGGLCTTVGAGGGYLAGGGHSPMSSKYGMGADQVLSIDVVTPDGRFVTANDEQNTELFWALRGGGGSTFGVVTSWTLKAYPKLCVASVMSFSLTSGTNFTSEALWQAVKLYFQSVPTYNAAGNYEYFQIVPSAYELSFGISAWFAPNMTVVEHQALVAPLFSSWSELGIEVSPSWQEFDSYLPAWKALTDAETVGSVLGRSSSRLLPSENVEDPTLFNQTFQVLRDFCDVGGVLVGYGLSADAGGSYPDNSVNPAWRKNVLYLIPAVSWSAGLSWAEVAAFSAQFTNEWLKPLRDITPLAGAYHSEGDIMEPNFQESFYGNATYERLYSFKQGIDPTGLFYAHYAVGSENWYVTGQIEGLPTQNGRLCHI